MSIYFHKEETRFTYTEKEKSKKWLREILREEKKKEGDINIIFTNDQTIHQLNRTYLSHDFYTDVIAFDYQKPGKITGDIYISIDTVKKNAKRYKCQFNVELQRVIVHGLLHLIGYNDKTEEEKKAMREKESVYLQRLQQ